MAWTRLVALVGVAPVCGCTLIPRAIYNVEYDHAVRSDLADLNQRHRRLAHDAWVEYWAASGEAVPDAGLEAGFVDGFADYLNQGGPGGPPAVPPNEFRFGDAHTPGGRRAAARYAEGFAAGALAAQASGLREPSIVPVFQPIRAADAPPPDAAPPARPDVLPVPARLTGREKVPPRSPDRPSPDDRRALPPAGP